MKFSSVFIMDIMNFLSVFELNRMKNRHQLRLEKNGQLQKLIQRYIGNGVRHFLTQNF